jgi:hypothetical protein
VLLQGAGRGARSENEHCVATLVTTRQQLEYFIDSSLGHTARMASFCLNCLEKDLDFDRELYRLFDHSAHDHVNQQKHLFCFQLPHSFILGCP